MENLALYVGMNKSISYYNNNPLSNPLGYTEANKMAAAAPRASSLLSRHTPLCHLLHSYSALYTAEF